MKPMLNPKPVLLWVLFACVLGGCASQSQLAASATSTMGNWSPVGSRQITRQKPYTLSDHYRLYLAWLPGQGPDSKSTDLNGQFSLQLSRYLQRYFLSVQQAPAPTNLATALDQAAAAGAEILMLARVESWPDIDPVRLQECKAEDGRKKLSFESCDQQGGSNGTMALSVALYDVQLRQPVDVISAVSQRGMASYLYDNADAELQQLCQLIAGQLTPRSAAN